MSMLAALKASLSGMATLWFLLQVQLFSGAEAQTQPTISNIVSTASGRTAAERGGVYGCYTTSTMGQGDIYYCDRPYVLLRVPTFLEGLPYVVTANSDKASDRADTDYLCMDVDVASTVYVLYDSRTLVPPAWLSATYTKASVSPVLVDDGMGAFDIWTASVAAGTVCFGGNFAVATEEQTAYDACVNTWTDSCDAIGDPPGEGSMFSVVVGPVLPAISGITGPATGDWVGDSGPGRLAGLSPQTGMCWTGVGTDLPTTVDDVDSVACESAGNLWKECYGASILATGEWMFCDRYYPYTNVPGFLQGLPFIQTANSDKASDRADTDFLCFDIDIDSTVYVLYDNRAVVLPDWLSTTFTSQHTAVAHVEDGMGYYVVYFAELPAGQVCMGGNFAVDSSQLEEFNLCYGDTDDAWGSNCDVIGDPPGEGSMYAVAVGLTGGRPNHEVVSTAQPEISSVVASATSQPAGQCWDGDIKVADHEANESACTAAGFVYVECYSVGTLAAPTGSIGSDYYMCDRAYTFEGTLPAYLDGIAAIKTANSDKASDRADTDFLCFDIDVPGTVYVLYDSRAVVLPAWLEHTFTNQHATVANVTDGVGAYNVYFAGFPAGQVCMGGNFAVATEEQMAYDACYATSDSWNDNCDTIGDPPGEGSMFVVAVGPLLTHSDVNLNGTSFAREVIQDVTTGDGTVAVTGPLACAGTVSGTTLSTDVSNLGRTETAEKVFSATLQAGTVSVSSCGSAELFDTTLSVYALTDGTPDAPDATTIAITVGGAAKTATRVAYHDGTGSTCGHLAEINDLTVTSGDYLVVIDGWPNGNSAQRHGDFSITLTCTPADDVDCVGSWDACTSACEAADARTFTTTTEPVNGGAACPVAALSCSGSTACPAAPAPVATSSAGLATASLAAAVTAAVVMH